jgi:hypothetical protein
VTTSIAPHRGTAGPGGSVSPDQVDLADDAGLVGRDLLAGRAEVLDVVDAHVVTTAMRPSTTFVASHVPPTPTSTTATSTATSENHENAAAVRI